MGDDARVTVVVYVLHRIIPLPLTGGAERAKMTREVVANTAISEEREPVTGLNVSEPLRAARRWVGVPHVSNSWGLGLRMFVRNRARGEGAEGLT